MVVDEAVVEATLQAAIRHGCRAAVLAMVRVVDVAVIRRPATAREYAVAVAGRDGAALTSGVTFGGVVGIEHPGLAVEECRGDRGVAQHSFDGRPGDAPAVIVAVSETEVGQIVERVGAALGERAPVGLRLGVGSWVNASTAATTVANAAGVNDPWISPPPKSRGDNDNE